MEISQSGIDLIEKWEGFFANAYDDGEGVWTVGYGTIRWDLKTPVKQGDTITREEAERQLRKECQRVEDAITRSIKVPLNSNEFSSLCSFGYNVGIGWITGEGHAQATFIKQLNKGNYAAVPAGLLQFVRGANTGKAYDGLLNRRKDEIKLWLTAVDDVTKTVDPAQQPTIQPTTPEDAGVPPMPQAITESRPAVMQTATDSKTVRWGAGALVTYLATQANDAYHWAFGLIKETGPQIVDVQSQLSPFGALIKMMPTLLGGLVVICIVGVIAQRISDRGKPR